MPSYRLPGEIRFATLEWTMPQARTISRTLGGGVVDAAYGASAGWAARGALVPLRGADAVRAQLLLGLLARPGGRLRLPYLRAGDDQTGPNHIGDAQLCSLAGWTLPGGIARLALADPTLPADFALRMVAGANRFARPNMDSWLPCAAGEKKALSGWFRRTAGCDWHAALQVSFRKADASSSGVDWISTTTVAADGVWRPVSGIITAPTDTVEMRIEVKANAGTAGECWMAGMRVADRPHAGTVTAAGSTVMAINLRDLGPAGEVLDAGAKATVRLPGDEEQLLMLAAPLVADGSGNGVLYPVWPARRLPADGAAIELARPWCRMILPDGSAPALRQRPAGVDEPAALEFEEAY
ncbi:MAG: hypothetical protein WDA25_09845 [Paracoccaceae bacterium]